MKKSLEKQVRQRAGNRCEYCQMPQHTYRFRFPIDHVLAKQHGGKTEASNLALACLRCNAHKGPNLAGLDPESGKMVRLFHPRTDRWEDHFQWRGPELQGLTEIGRATIVVLTINDPGNIAVRKSLTEEGDFRFE